MYLVTQSKRKDNQLGYDAKKSEYVYIYKGSEIWRERGDTSLLDYFNDLRNNKKCINESKIARLSTSYIWVKYIQSCNRDLVTIQHLCQKIN